eukprot:comp19966_c0_seq1/m.24335 comp19966_c0_seq1/g.24335  ORF comp19966_c0_seq1/g.24335 comp19966_c0_seq1/m.24335 type:complete len:683 (-) comp19966_c0_seq1:171-2219(-)
MGISGSTLSKLGENEMLRRLVGDEKFPETHDFWETVLDFRFIFPRDSPDGRQVEDAVKGLCASFIANNTTTRNLETLVKILSSTTHRLCAHTGEQSERDRLLLRVHNALLVLRMFCKFTVEAFRGDALEDIYAMGGSRRAEPPDSRSGPHLSDAQEADVSTAELPLTPSELHNGEGVLVLLDDMAGAATKLLTELEICDASYWVHAECVALLLVFLSSQIYTHPDTLTPMTMALLLGKSSSSACEVMSVLLQYYIERKPPPTGNGVFSFLASLTSTSSFTFSYLFHSTPTPIELPMGDSGMGDDCEVLFLVLSCTTGGALGWESPFRTALQKLPDADAAENSKGVSFARLYECLSTRLEEDGAVLLLYMMLYHSPPFAAFVLSRTDLETLLLPMLRQLYSDVEDVNRTYLLLVCVLLLSQDDSFNKFIHELVLTDTTWFEEKGLGSITLGGMLVLVLIRVMQANMLKHRDVYVHTTCLGSLANMSSGFNNLHAYAAQRIVRLFDLLSRKFSKLDGLQVLDNIDNGEVADQAEDVVIYADSMRIVLESISNSLAMHVHHNPHLIYTLLHKRELVLPYRAHPLYADTVHNIEQVLDFFQKKLAGHRPEALSYQLVFAVIESTSRQFSLGSLKKLPVLKFQYEEQERPGHFFLPYVWTVAYNAAPTCYSQSGVTLFTVQKATQPE